MRRRFHIDLEPLEDRRLLSGPGSLDPSFGAGGTVTTTFSGRDIASKLLVQADGKVVAVGANMARYNDNGTLDATFGKGGKVTSVSSRSAALVPAGTANAGKIVVAGTSSTKKTGSDFTLTRYNANGSVDASFGTRGVVTTDLGGYDVTEAVAVQPDGKIVVAGESTNTARTLADGFGLARYNADGTLDTSFGSGGKVVTPLWNCDLHSLALQPDGKIVVVAQAASTVGQEFHFTVARYNANGTLDTGFGPAHNGLVLVTDMLADHPGVTSGGWYSDTLAYEAYDVAVQADGKIVAVGETYGNAQGDGWLIARFDAAGNLDDTFGIRGTTFVKPSGDINLWDQAFGVALQADGRIVVAGGGDNAAEFYVGRFDAAGNLDGTFGSGGLVHTVVGSSPNQARDVAIQPDGKIVVSGDAATSSGIGFGLARYLAPTTMTAMAGTLTSTAAAPGPAPTTPWSDASGDDSPQPIGPTIPPVSRLFARRRPRVTLAARPGGALL
ncbi:hypothetical protein OJF2_77120 [Aquisphaera giovannonii]|uniref:Delta-60 repeat domain protein n=2 Tax=Aquisphaera giovannonii TaxID=406548 RepID=A0A5B9WGY1_9BACT|nr:hypothetical protein OJF2_77120 [Aquisphaera giovannonii]